jgi:methenyltetrahydromethanopterin cyclohydrolase
MCEVRKLEGGDIVVDLGTKWFRVRADGTVTTKQCTRAGKVKARQATSAEITFAKRSIDKHNQIGA